MEEKIREVLTGFLSPLTNEDESRSVIMDNQIDDVVKELMKVIGTSGGGSAPAGALYF